MSNKLLSEKFFQRLSMLTATKKRVYFTGFIFAFAITLKEVLGSSFNNFQIFRFASTDFWAGINPYTSWEHLSIVGKPLDNFLYGPLFSILFTPFAIFSARAGVLVWNVFTYSVFFLSIFTLPERFDFKKKKFIFFISALLLFATLLSVQFNPVVAALFLFSFTLLEKKHGFWAVLLIFISGFTKVYGIFQIAMILFYHGFRRNLMYSVIIGIAFLFLPLINIPVNELVAYYQSWITTVFEHSEALLRFSIFRPLCSINRSIEPYAGILSLLIYSVILLFTFLKLKIFRESFLRRAQFLGMIMSWSILFGVGSEKHTYVIAMAGYAIWYICTKPSLIDKSLLWMNFILLGILPIDIFCPWIISNFILSKLQIGIIVFTITWMIMFFKTFFAKEEPIV